jgi:hypothetical protein
VKQTILVCDWCTGPRANAVTTLSLTNGRKRKGGPQLDLCAAHSRDLQKLFVPKKAAGDVPRQNRPAKKYPKLPEDFDNRVLEVISKLKQASTGDVAKVLKVPRHQAAGSMARFFKAKKIVRVGKGKFTTYHVA